MRILGFQKQWINHLTGKPKLSEPEFTTFRWTRRDRDWEVGEIVQVVLKPRTKERLPLGEAIIVSKEPRTIINENPNFKIETKHITDAEAQQDGFPLAIGLKWIWLGVSVENQKRADERIPILLQIPAAKHFVSVEPMLRPVSLRWLAVWNGLAQQPRPATTNELDGLRRLDWVIAGPETGPKARPCNKEWIEDLYNQCRAAGVPFWDKTDILGKNIKEQPNG